VQSILKGALLRGGNNGDVDLERPKGRVGVKTVKKRGEDVSMPKLSRRKCLLGVRAGKVRGAKVGGEEKGVGNIWFYHEAKYPRHLLQIQPCGGGEVLLKNAAGGEEGYEGLGLRGWVGGGGFPTRRYET